VSTGRDGWRLAVGTLTTIPVRPPSVVDRAVAGRAMLLAPLAALPLALIPLLAHTAIRWLGMPPLLAAALTVAGLALANRGLHVDGLADTADGLAASYDRDRALEVMRRGDVGPAGVATVVLVLLIQVVALADLLQLPSWDRPLLAALAVAASRHTLAWVCGRAFPAARPEGLGAAVAGSVPSGAAAAAGLALAAVGAVAISVLAPTDTPWSSVGWYAAPVTIAVAVVAALAVALRARSRLGGVTGDVLGAGVEISLAAALTVAVCLG